MQFADRLKNVETSAIRELFKLLGKPGIISFAGGFPDPALFDAQGIAQAAQAVLSTNPGPVLQYGATEGYQPLREGISSFMAAKGSHVEPDGLIVTTGSQQALDLIGKTLISPGDKVIVEAPTFLATIQCFRLYGAHIIGAPIDADGVDVDKLEALIEEHKPKLVYLIPTFGNPSGATLSLVRRQRILEIAARTQTLVVEDDPYGELYFDQPPPPSLLALSDAVPGSRDWLAHCGSFSKILSPGLRVGWLIAPPALLANATMCKQFSDAHTSNLTQAICAQYLGMNRLDGTLAVVRKTYFERARVMAESLRRDLGDAIAFNQPQGGMFFWARLTGSSGKTAQASDFAKRAIDQGVAFVPGAPFFAHDPDLSTLRLSFATADVAKIEEGIGRLARAL
ncbi:MAG: PLP-dependent aminotransferase family protein [Gammaproteobacteria bacterium]|uniref:aminotransferase-like domain-containing protein n=1 Tax=Rhodoferax sp. TaxID=50421 RepID=UPI0017919BDD|nr:PLP-dependent aminotransferase family protein [Rhodoferax sp.]MBU3897625.1 PLP-dependent aminotransferase family protein [Gammaproteobacteria bacterium]MBA3058251.1 PLP-dependent aminotransferase family protein [Rhodoferax sp.]MBU3999470.1 PLP-dependent aminotransferase family protein [Gammaproteobacteria bacterium]MBU4017731.1 PLP-dependent aminotransferase family protein [Gammaproteobacteria bacterium]MBU4081174.1 PLP-dependent aminotransferase family protein [Gammaproteobacteria bacteriu